VARRDAGPGRARAPRSAFDLPGFGEADKPEGASYRAVDFFLPMLGAFLDAVDLPSAHLVGSSMGASLALRFAAHHPDRVRRVVAANPGGFGRYIHPFLRAPTLPGLGKPMSRPMRPTNAVALGLTVHRKARRTAELLDEIDRFSKMPGAHMAFVRTLKGLATPLGLKDIPEFEADVARIKAESLIVWGDRDRIFPVKQADRARNLMPAARIEIMDDVGHFPQIDAPQEFSRLVSDFLEARAVSS
jgi:pimeloyl-ACP methyl ester carboxylesterase